jgi:ABC-type cobalamin/Fe3+-siderophores transport system ATPase subunit
MAGRVIASGPPDKALTPDTLRAAYGAALIHVDEDELFLDDPAHQPTEGRHIHQSRSIHPEAVPDDRHS